MPLGFSGGQWLAQMGERYGDKLARGIIDAGAKIEQGLMRVTTNKQLAGLGETLGQLNPQSDDYTQKLIQIAPSFPMAMQDPRGQAMMAIGVKANAQWKQTQQAQLRLGQQLQNQKTMQGIRQTDELARINARNQGKNSSEVDLLNMPNQLTPQNPATVSGFGTDEELVNPQEEMPAGAPLNVNDVPLGLPPLPDNISPANRGALRDSPQRSAPIPEVEAQAPAPVDPLVERALKPLKETQRITGTKPTKSQVFGAISAERTRAQQEKMQEDRQAKKDQIDTRKEALKAKDSEAAAIRSEARAERSRINRDISVVEKDIAAARRNLESFHKEFEKMDYETKKSNEGKLKELQGNLQANGDERSRLQGLLAAVKEQKDADQVFKDEDEAIAAGFKAGDEIMLINPRTGKPARAILE